MQTPMNIDAQGLTQLRALELCKLTAYWDVTGWALGYGTHKPEFTSASTCTNSEAEQWLEDVTNKLSFSISKLVIPTLLQGQFNALVIFAYNIGIGAFASSTLLQRLNSGNIDSVPFEMLRWIYTDHRINPVLQDRRMAEIKIWQDAA